MKLIKTVKDNFHFHLAQRERDLLLHVLQLYPQIPSGYQRLSKASKQEESNQKLLDDALAETRSQNRKHLELWLANPRRLSQVENGWRLTISSGDLDWLLQVLNDVRIGSWIRLGSPDPPLQVLKPESAPHFWAMEMAGYFQMRFLEVFEP